MLKLLIVNLLSNNKIGNVIGWMGGANNGLFHKLL